MAKVNAVVEMTRADGRKEYRNCPYEGDFDEGTNQYKYIVLQSPNGTKYKVEVDDLGTIITTPV